MRKRVFGLAMGLFLLAAADGRAQTAWDAPLLLPPNSQPGWDVFLMSAAEGDVGVLGSWRSGGPQHLRIRGGLAEDYSDDLAFFGGVDVAGALVRESVDFPMDIDWVFGGGLSVGDNVFLAFPAGVTVGHTFDSEGIRFTPYLSPRVVLDAMFIDTPAGNDNEMELNFALDLGMDLGFQPGWLIRFGATVGGFGDGADRDALAIGIVF